MTPLIKDPSIFSCINHLVGSHLTCPLNCLNFDNGVNGARTKVKTTFLIKPQVLFRFSVINYLPTYSAAI